MEPLLPAGMAERETAKLLDEDEIVSHQVLSERALPCITPVTCL